MEYADFLSFLANNVPHDQPTAAQETTLDLTRQSPPVLPVTDRQLLDLKTLEQTLLRDVLVVTNNPLYVVYLLACSSVAVDMQHMPYPYAAYYQLLLQTRIELSNRRLDLHDMAYADALRRSALAHQHTFRKLNSPSPSSASMFPVTFNVSPFADKATGGVNIVTYDFLDTLQGTMDLPDTVPWWIYSWCDASRQQTLLELSAPVFCDHVLVGPERFVMHPNTLASLRVVSPATHDYTDFARWLNPDQLQGTLIVLLFGDTMSLDSPLQESYVHRELLRITQKMTVQEYVTMCLCELYVAQQREYHVVVDVQWLRRRGLVLLDEQLDASNTLRAYVVQCLCHNLVVTYTAHDPAEDGLVVDGETRRWRDVQLRHRLHKEQIRQL